MVIGGSPDFFIYFISQGQNFPFAKLTEGFHVAIPLDSPHFADSIMQASYRQHLDRMIVGKISEGFSPNFAYRLW